MSDETSKRHARAVLEGQGFHVAELKPRPNRRTADLLASWSDEHYLIEAKGKDVTETFRALEREAHVKGYSLEGRRLKGWNRLSAILADVEDQLRQTDEPADAFRVLWVSCLHSDAMYVIEEFRKRLYGTASVMLWESQRHRLARPIGYRDCYYYDSCDFFRYQDVDAVFLACENLVLLCINEFSSRLAGLRVSKLYKTWSSSNTVIDPERLEAEGRALAIRGSVDRSDSYAKFEYIRTKYGYYHSVTEEVLVKGLISMPIEPANGGTS